MTKSKKTDRGFLNPYVLVNELDLDEGMSVVDFGSGAGHWALAIAGAVGKTGQVYAVDVRKEVLEVLEGHIKLDGLFHIKTIQADLEKEGSTGLRESSQDVVFCSNIIHQLKKPKNALQEAYNILKDGGRLIVVDWAKDASLGPGKRVEEKEVKKIAKEAGFSFNKSIDAGHSHYGLIFSK